MNEKIQAIDPKKAFQEFADDNPSIFLDNIKEQLYSGRNSKNVGIPYRSLSYEKKKKQMNPSANGMTDFFLTGEFYKSLYTRSEQNGLSFFSDLEYSKKLFQGKYADSYNYNSNQQKKVVADIIKNGFINYLI